MTIFEDAVPHAVASCHVPFSIKEKVTVRLADLEQKGIIARVYKPTDWVSPLVVCMKKLGDIWLCIDPQALNQALKHELHSLPIIDDILPDLADAKVFSKFDLRNGYWHLFCEFSHNFCCLLF